MTVIPKRFHKLLMALTCLVQQGCMEEPAQPNVNTFDANGIKIAYSVEGDGAPVILIHGWLSSTELNWVLPGTSALLGKEYRVIALDVRGHGKSAKPTEEDSYGAELVEDVVRLMDHLKIEKAHIVGYSMGGIIAANLLVRHPERVRSCTLGGMGWLKKGSAAEWLFSQIGKKHKDAKALTICGRSFAKLALTQEELLSIQVPVQVLVGADDRLIKKLYVQPLQRVRPDWNVVEIVGGGHFTTVLKPQFRDEIAAWLALNGYAK